MQNRLENIIGKTAAVMTAAWLAGCVTTNGNGYNLKAIYPSQASCPPIASPYQSLSHVDGTSRRTPNGGIGIPLEPETPIYASADGNVIYVTPNSVTGLDIGILHSRKDLGLKISEPDGRNFVGTLYAYVTKPMVKVGDKVKMGQKIAVSGPHPNGDQLLFGVYVASGSSSHINPLLFFSGVLDDASIVSNDVFIPYTDGKNHFPAGTKKILPVACPSKAN